MTDFRDVECRKRYNTFFFLRFLLISANIPFYELMISKWSKMKARFRFCYELLVNLP